jgi:transcriptional regulator with XRE-family HTH domain
MTLGQRIKQKREELGISQRALARKADINASTMNRIEFDLHDMYITNFIKLVRALETTPDKLLDYKMSQPSPYSQP